MGLSFLDGVEAACESYGLALVGGDTIALAAGRAARARPDRDRPRRRAHPARAAAGKAGDALVAGRDARRFRGRPRTCSKRIAARDGPLVDVYRRPVPLLAAGQALAPHAHAMMDVSDGLLLDALRLAEASGCGADDRPRCRCPCPAPSSPSGARTRRRGCSPRPAATIMRCSPRLPAEFDPVKPFFTYRARPFARIGTLAADSGSLFHSSAAGARCRCRSAWP